MKKIIFLITFCLPLLLGSCVKKIADVTITIYGTVVEADSQVPVSGVLVSVLTASKSKVTGNDGYFEFSELEADKQHTITAQKEGYGPDRRYVIANAGESVEINLTIKKEKE